MPAVPGQKIPKPFIHLSSNQTSVREISKQKGQTKREHMTALCDKCHDRGHSGGLGLCRVGQTQGQGDPVCIRRVITAVSLQGMIRRTGGVQGWPDQEAGGLGVRQEDVSCSPCVATHVSVTRIVQNGNDRAGKGQCP